MYIILKHIFTVDIDLNSAINGTNFRASITFVFIQFQVRTNNFGAKK